MGNLFARARANPSALITSLITAIAVLAVMAVTAVESSAKVSNPEPPLELLTLQVATGTNVRIEVTANGSIADAVIEQSTEPRQATIRISGVKSQLKTEYPLNNRLVHSVHAQTGQTNGVDWVELVIDIDESAAVNYQRASRSLIIEVSGISYFSSLRAPASVQTNTRNSSSATVAQTNNSTASEPPISAAATKLKTADAAIQSNIAPPGIAVSALQTVATGRDVRIEVAATGALTDAVIEQVVGPRQATLRISGATSQLAAEYPVNNPLVQKIRSRAGNENGVPWVELVIDLYEGAAINYQKQSKSLIIEATPMGYFTSSRTPAPDSQNSPSAAASAKSTNKEIKDRQPRTNTAANVTKANEPIKNSTPNSPAPDITPSATQRNQDGVTDAHTAKSETQRPQDNVAASPTAKLATQRKEDGVVVPQPVKSEIPFTTRGTFESSWAKKAALTNAVPQSNPTAPTNLTVSETQQAGEVHLHGVVTDQMGALIVGASIVLDDSHGHKYTARTDNGGRYDISNIAPGNYVLTATSEGFDTFKQQIEIAPQKIAALDVTLKILVNVQVEVRAGPANDLSGTILTAKDIESLPTEPDRLIRKLQEMAAMMGIPNARILVDGGADRLPAKEDIQMIKISPHSFAAEYSQPTEGVIEVTTKPGGHFHGDFSFAFNDEALNARNAFASSRAPLQIREYNGYLSGPIIPHRWSFSAYVGRYERDENAVVNAVILDPVSLLPSSFGTTVQTPNREQYLSLGTTYLLRQKHTLRLKYSSSDSSYLNGGVGGFDLPERAYNSSAHSYTLKAGATSIFSERMINELRTRFSRSSSMARASNFAPAVFVLDSFNAGGNQESLLNEYSSRNLELADSLTYTHHKHMMKFGFGGYGASISNIERSNFGGTFTFGSDVERDASGNPILVDGQPITISALERYRRTLLALPGYGPSQFSIVRGNPSIGLKQWEMAWFAQDDWALSPRVTFSYGVRHDFQTNLSDKLNLAPRLGLALRPFKKRQDVLRAGAGIFYGGVSSDLTLETVKLDGQHQQQLDVQDPKFFPKVPDNLDGAAETLPTVRRKDPSLHAPFYFISSVIYQPQLFWGLNGSINYTWQRGYRMLRERNVNAPISLTGLRPFANQGPILQFESTGNFTRNALEFSLGKSISSKISIHGTYTLAYARSDTDGAYYAPANSYDLSNEYGRAAGDARHQFKLQGWMSLPWNVDLSPYFYVSSGSPFNITTGQDNNGDTLFTDRPAFAQAGDPGAVVTQFGIFQPNPRPGDQIILRNLGQGPGTVSAGLNLSKTISFHLPISKTAEGEGFGSILSRGRNSARGPYSLTFNLDVQNLLNHTNLGQFNGVLTSPFFGKANRAESPRKVRLSLDLSFE